MILKMMETGPLMVNCYIVADEETKEAAVFDPAGKRVCIRRSKTLQVAASRQARYPWVRSAIRGISSLF